MLKLLSSLRHLYKVSSPTHTLSLSSQSVRRKALTRFVSSAPAELHDFMGEEAGRAIGMPLTAFTDEAYKGLVEGKDQIVIGTIADEKTFHEVVDKRRALFTDLGNRMRGLELGSRFEKGEGK